MNKLDSILSKLRTQNAYVQGVPHDQPSETDQIARFERQDSISPGIRVNKRKNFTPKIVRTGDDQFDQSIIDHHEQPSTSSVDDAISAKRSKLDTGSRGISVISKHSTQNGNDDHESPGSLAIVEPDEDLGPPSGRSSSNRSNSLFTSGEFASSSASPNFLFNAVTSAFNSVANRQSPSSITSISPLALTATNNRYSQERVEPDKKDTQSASGRNDQHTQPIVSYIVRFLGNDCGAEQCRFATAKEHFHCKLCNNKLFTKKEEMLRHYKWHRKREESLAYGFMRYSASDDCSLHFKDCVHNLRQTHYHCLQDTCDKVYISTSDVQMHANSHRKQAHIAKEGFQRVKGSEHCAFNACPFTDPTNRTTHFHCLRPGCTHSFKNKADMDKHKAHHMRDEQLTRDGFKKYMKSEGCTFGVCAFSKVVNHIHCIRPGCNYVLHSTSQMYSHKRKHEKQDKRVNEYVAQQQSMANALKNASAFISTTGANTPANFSSSSSSPTSPNATTIIHHFPNDFLPFPQRIPNGNDQSISIAHGSTKMQNRLKLKQYDPQARNFHNADIFDPKSGTDQITDHKSTNIDSIEKADDSDHVGIDMNTLQSPIQFLRSVTKVEADICTDDGDAGKQQSAVNGISNQAKQIHQQQGVNGRSKGDDSWKKFITRYTANDPCLPLCPLIYKDHYHCTAGEGCKMTFKSKDGVRDHAKQHEQLCVAMEHFHTHEIGECKFDGCAYSNRERHYHCSWPNCMEIIGSTEPVFRRLEHHKVHEYSNQLLIESRPSIGANPVLKNANIETPTPASPTPSSGSGTAMSEIYKRKRGRPPKYNVLDVNVNPSTHVGQSPDILLTSFKLAKAAGQAAAQQSQQEQQPSPSAQHRRGRPRTVSSPRQSQQTMEDLSISNQNATIALLQQHHLQQQLELLRMWNANLDSLVPSSQLFNGGPQRSEQSVSTAPKRPQFDGFTTYLATENCPDSMCRYRNQLHYHCRLPRCFYSSDRGEHLESHHRDFHEAFEIPDGYACYDRSYNCRHASCQYNGHARHFHCQKAGCSAALLKFNELNLHTLKGHDGYQHDQFGSSQNPISHEPTDLSGEKNQKSSQIVRTTGIFFPAPAANQAPTNTTAPIQSVQQFGQQLPTSSALSMNSATFAALAQSLSPAFALFNAAAALGICTGSSAIPNIGTSTNSMAGLNQGTPLPYTVEQQCGRPFCKLKRRMHFHCTLCHQGFSHFDRLTVHMQKHGIVLPPLLAQQPPPPTPTTISAQVKTAVQAVIGEQQKSKMAQQINRDTKVKSEPTDTSINQASKKVKFHVFQPNAMKFSDGSNNNTTTQSNAEAKKASISSAVDAVIMDASMAAKQSKKSVQNSTSDPVKTTVSTQNSINSMQFKFVDCTTDLSNSIDKHSNRGSIQVSMMNIGHPDSIFPPSISPVQNSESKKPRVCTDELCPKMAGSRIHYHCEKCEFWTPESTKWHVHVKQHARMDQVAALGFRKVLGNAGTNGTVNGDIPSISCPLSIDCTLANQSHYHCTICNFAAFNQSQMSTHKTTKHPDPINNIEQN